MEGQVLMLLIPESVGYREAHSISGCALMAVAMVMMIKTSQTGALLKGILAAGSI
jgi:hypothetical protein